MWPNTSFLDLVGVELPIIQAPMAGASGPDMAIAAAKGGALGSLPCAMLDATKTRTEITAVQQQTSMPLNLNFFCHTPQKADPERETVWRNRLASYYQEFGVDPSAQMPSISRAPFNESMCEIVEEFTPKVVSFHFGLPEPALLNRVKASGAVVLGCATTVEEAAWLEKNGCDAIIAQGYEAGGHRGMFMAQDINTQVGTMALVPQVVDAVNLPVIAAGGVADARGIVAAFALGAAGVQMGTAYLFTPESTISDIHRNALKTSRDDQTALTNVFSGKPARGLMNRIMQEVGPMSAQAPVFPTAGGALAPLKAKAEQESNAAFSSMWSGQSAALGREMGTLELTQLLASEALGLLKSLG